MPCPFQSTLDLLGRRHALTIVWFLMEHAPARFNDIASGVATNNVTLSARLKELEAAGIVTRRAYAEVPPRVEYDLTERGRELMPLLSELDDWSSRHGQMAEAVVYADK